MEVRGENGEETQEDDEDDVERESESADLAVHHSPSGDAGACMREGGRKHRDYTRRSLLKTIAAHSKEHSGNRRILDREKIHSIVRAYARSTGETSQKRVSEVTCNRRSQCGSSCRGATRSRVNDEGGHHARADCEGRVRDRNRSRRRSRRRLRDGARNVPQDTVESRRLDCHGSVRGSAIPDG